MTAADDGTNADFASGGGAIDRAARIALDQGASFQGGPQPRLVSAAQQRRLLRWVEIEDHGTEIALRFFVRNHRDEVKVQLSTTVRCEV
jgi:hypothetical protein